jgi:hypothetical protein
MNARDLSNRLVALLRRERHAMADFLLALADFDREKTWRELGHASLFSYLRREMGLSAGAAQYRKTAAELIQAHPAVEAALRRGDLCLSSMIELAKVITPENALEILPRFYGLSRREAADVAVSIRPVEKPPVREVLAFSRPSVASAVDPTRASVGTHSPVSPAEASGAGCLAANPVRPAEVPALSPSGPAARAGLVASTVEPLGPDLARFHLTVSRRFIVKLKAAKDALSHARPGASTEEVLEACLDLMLAERAKRKGLVENPRKTTGPADAFADRIPAAVRRAAFERADGRCEWRFASGVRCGCTTRLQFDHVVPKALGGPPTLENVRVLCAPHNRLAARRVFGDAWMDRYERRGGRADRASPAPTGWAGPGPSRSDPRGEGRVAPPLSESGS